MKEAGNSKTSTKTAADRIILWKCELLKQKILLIVRKRLLIL
jgi:hypothetical protein